jgi:hypothetical protein
LTISRYGNARRQGNMRRGTVKNTSDNRIQKQNEPTLD